MAKNVNLVVMSANTVANGATIYSAAWDGERASGFAGVLIQLAAASNVTITQQGSVYGSVFHDVVSSTGSALGAVITAGTGTAAIYTQFSPVVARYSRFKVVAGADSTVTLTVNQSEQA